MKNSKKLMKDIKSIDKFWDIESIEYDHIKLKNGEYLKGIKIMPFDITTAVDNEISTALNTIRYAFNRITFKVYHSVVFSKADFSTYNDEMLENWDQLNQYQRAITYNEIEKNEIFKRYHKNIEFFMIVKNKNLDLLNKQIQELSIQLSRFYKIYNLSNIDYKSYIKWLFDIDDDILIKGLVMGDEFDVEKDIDSKLIEEYEQLPRYKTSSLFKLDVVKEYKNYVMFNDNYYSVMLMTSLPNPFQLGLFNMWAKNRNNKLLWITEDSKLDIRKFLKVELNSLSKTLRIAQKQKDLNEVDRVKQEIKTLQEYSSRLIASKDKTLDLSVAMIIKANNIDDLNYRKDQLLNVIHDCYCPSELQLPLLKYFTPIFDNKTILNKKYEFNVGFPIATSDYSITYPYHFSELDDENGYLYGYELSMNGRIVFNPYYYLDNPRVATEQGRLNGNIVLGGESGSGKTTDLFLLIRYLYRINAFVMWIDPENTNKEFVLDNGGTYLEFGSNQYRFNIFQLRRVTVDDNSNNVEMTDEEIKEREQILYDVSQAIVTATDDFKNVLSLYQPNISDNTLSIVGLVTQHMYENHIVKDINNEEVPMTKLSTFSHLINTDYPIMTDFNNSLNILVEEHKDNVSVKTALMDLAIKIMPFLNEHKYVFNGHTTSNIELKKGHLVGIGTKFLYDKPQNLQNALYYIITSQAFNNCLTLDMKSAFIYDEAHTILNNNDIIINLIDQFTRRSRKYYNICVLATQEWADFSSDKMRSIINNSTYLIMKLTSKSNALNTLENLIGINERERYEIEHFNQGDSLLFLGNKKFYSHTFITKAELQEKGGNYENINS